MLNVDPKKTNLRKVVGCLLENGDTADSILNSILESKEIASEVLRTVGCSKVVACLLASNLTIRQIAEVLGCDYWPVYRLIEKDQIPKPAKTGRRLSKDTIREIKRLLFVEGLTPLETMRKLNLKSRSTIYGVISTAIRTEEARAGEVTFRKTEGQRCPVHGPVEVWPCVACEAESERRKSFRTLLG